MAGITLAQAEAKLAEYLAAESKALNAQSYGIADRNLQRARLDDIRAGIKHWQGEVERLAAGKGRSRARLGLPI